LSCLLLRNKECAWKSKLTEDGPRRREKWTTSRFFKTSSERRSHTVVTTGRLPSIPYGEGARPGRGTLLVERKLREMMFKGLRMSAQVKPPLEGGENNLELN